MNSDEIKIARQIPSFGRRAHTKADLLRVLAACGIAVAVLDLGGIGHFSVFNELEKICFFDAGLSDLEFARAGFTTFCFYLLGGRGADARASLNSSETLQSMRRRADHLMRCLIAPAILLFGATKFSPSRTGAPPTRRRHRIAAAPPPPVFLR